MKKALKWMTGLLLGVLLLGAAGGWVLQRWLGSTDFKSRVETEAGSALGVELGLQGIDVSIWPTPSLTVSGLEIRTRPQLTLEKLLIRPDVSALFAGRVTMGSVEIQGAKLPQAGVDALILSLGTVKKEAGQDAEAPPSPVATAAWTPQRVVLEDVTWVNAKGAATTVSGEAVLDAQGLPQSLRLSIQQGFLRGASARLVRRDRVMDLNLEVGGGTVSGPIELGWPGGAGAKVWPATLAGTLETRNVELAALSTAKSPVLTGKLDATTRFSAQSERLAGLLAVLRSDSTFTVKQAVVHGLDLAKAVKTVGLNRGGETALDVLAGQVSTKGRAVELSHLVASSGVLSASGNVAVTPARALSGRISVDLAANRLGGAVGVPLVVGGTLDAPALTLSRSALIGAAIGTVVMPGVGTGAGASVGERVGDQLKKLFGN